MLRFGRGRYVLGWAAFILLLSSIPNDFPASEPSELNADKAVHFALFFVLAALAATAGMRSRPRVSPIAVGALVVVTAGAFGAADEVYQRLIPGRDPKVFDWLADATGAVVGAATAIVITKWPLCGSR